MLAGDRRLMGQWKRALLFTAIVWSISICWLWFSDPKFIHTQGDRKRATWQSALCYRKEPGLLYHIINMTDLCQKRVATSTFQDGLLYKHPWKGSLEGRHLVSLPSQSAEIGETHGESLSDSIHSHHTISLWVWDPYFLSPHPHSFLGSHIYSNDITNHLLTNLCCVPLAQTSEFYTYALNCLPNPSNWMPYCCTELNMSKMKSALAFPTFQMFPT